jgi:serine/threonine protein kinase
MGSPAPDASGTLLRGRYRLGQLIARGGVASVYRAYDEHLERDVAVKIFETTESTLGDIRRQESEVKVLASLNHHSLITLHDAGLDETNSDEPRVYLVMELVDGANLRDALALGPLSSRHIAQIGYDLAEGLEYIHDHGVVHRDIKPANILLAEYSNDSRARAKLTDFGIALLESGERLTTDGTTTGTAEYLSPEQAKADLVGPASDVYSLGLVLLECFTGEMAFPGQPVQSALARLLKDPEMPDDLAPEWRELLAAMTARDPEKRPVSRDLVLALRQAVITETGRHAADPSTLRSDHGPGGACFLGADRDHQRRGQGPGVVQVPSRARNRAGRPGFRASSVSDPARRPTLAWARDPGRPARFDEPSLRGTRNSVLRWGSAPHS